MPIMPLNQLPLNRSLGNNYGRINPANGRANAQAATYTSNVTGAPTAGGMQNMPNGVQPQEWFGGPQPPAQAGGAGAFAGYGQAIRQMMENHKAQSKGDPGFWLGGPQPQQPQPRQGARTLPYMNPEVQAMRDALYRYGVDDQGGQAQTMEWNEARDRRPGDDVMQLLGQQQQSAVFQPQQVLKQFPQGQLRGSQPQSAVHAPQQGQKRWEGAQDFSPHDSILIQQYQAAQENNERDAAIDSNRADQRRQYQEQAAAANRAEFNSINNTPDARHQQQMAQANELERQQTEAYEGGSQDYNIARGRGTPDQEAALQSQLAQGQNRDINREFGAEMDRFRRLAAMQSAVHQPQQGVSDSTLNDRQGLIKAYRDRGVGEGRVMLNLDPNSLDYERGALTSRGNTSRPGGAITSNTREDADGNTLTGQIGYDGQLISARTAPAHMDAAARNRERINRRREERGGMSERQARDISRRARNPKALEAYAIRNGLENNAMVQSMLSGQGPSAVHGSQGASSGGPYSTTERNEAAEQAAGLRAGSAFANSAGFAQPGMNETETATAILNHGQPPTFEELGEWATIHQEENKSSNNDYTKGEGGRGRSGGSLLHPILERMDKLAKSISSGSDQKAAMEEFNRIQQEYHSIMAEQSRQNNAGVF
jgi:hypothetical protein